jgi:hypothetical protein
MTRRRLHAVILGAVICLWGPAVAYGIRTLLVYSYTPGRAATPVKNFPRGTALKLSPGRASLLLFLHPQCPCSRATLGELERIISRGGQNLDVTAVFHLPAGQPESWAKTSLWDRAASIPHLRTIVDRGAQLSRIFGAYTSGQALLYSPHGNLVFSGGITAARGHSGDNAGRDAIVAFLEHNTLPPRPTPVFGCSLIEGE